MSYDNISISIMETTNGISNENIIDQSNLSLDAFSSLVLNQFLQV